MANVSRFNAVLGQQFWLKRKDAQHMVGRLADFFHTIGTPSPDGRADKVHRLDTGLTQRSLQAQIEVRCIHTHKNRWRMRNQALAQLFANAQQLGHAGQHFPAVAVHGQTLGLPPRVKAALLHLLAANAHRCGIGPALAQAIQQQGSQQIARGLARHHGDAGRY